MKVTYLDPIGPPASEPTPLPPRLETPKSTHNSRFSPQTISNQSRAVPTDDSSSLDETKEGGGLPDALGINAPRAPRVRTAHPRASPNTGPRPPSHPFLLQRNEGDPNQPTPTPPPVRTFARTSAASPTHSSASSSTASIHPSSLETPAHFHMHGGLRAEEGKVDEFSIEIESPQEPPTPAMAAAPMDSLADRHSFRENDRYTQAERFAERVRWTMARAIGCKITHHCDRDGL